MPGIIGTQVIKDGNGTAIIGGVRMFDVSGTGVGPWVPVSLLYDPASGQFGAIKAASTAPVATDPALVVAISPNGQQAPGQLIAAQSTSVVLSSDNNAVTSTGSVAAGATDSGNPVKVGAVYNSAKPTLTTGQRGDLQLGTRGSLVVQLGLPDAGPATFFGTGTDGNTNSLNMYANVGYAYTFNGATWDRARGNVDTAALINAAAATTTQTGADLINQNARGVKVVLNMATIGTGSVTLTIQGKDAASGQYYTLLAGVAVVVNSVNVYEVYPGIPAVANVAASAALPRTWRVLVTANNANATTYTVGASVIL